MTSFFISAYADPLSDDELADLALLVLCERNGFDALDGFDHSRLARAMCELLQQRGIHTTLKFKGRVIE